MTEQELKDRIFELTILIRRISEDISALQLEQDDLEGERDELEKALKDLQTNRPPF